MTIGNFRPSSHRNHSFTNLVNWVTLYNEVLVSAIRQSLLVSISSHYVGCLKLEHIENYPPQLPYISVLRIYNR